MNIIQTNLFSFQSLFEWVVERQKVLRNFPIMIWAYRHSFHSYLCDNVGVSSITVQSTATYLWPFQVSSLLYGLSPLAQPFCPVVFCFIRTVAGPNLLRCNVLHLSFAKTCAREKSWTVAPFSANLTHWSSPNFTARHFALSNSKSATIETGVSDKQVKTCG